MNEEQESDCPTILESLFATEERPVPATYTDIGKEVRVPSAYGDEVDGILKQWSYVIDWVSYKGTCLFAIRLEPENIAAIEQRLMQLGIPYKIEEPCSFIPMF
jgi:hypothetical protein